MKFHYNIQTGQRKKSSAFTLIEILVVVAVIALLLSVGGLGIGQSMSAMQLSGAANNLNATLNHAALLARKENRPVQVRFYKYSTTLSEASLYRAYQLATLDGIASNGQSNVRLLTEITSFPEGVVLAIGDDHNSLISLGESSPGGKDPVLSSAYTYSSFEIRPDGLTTLPKNQPGVITLVQEAQMKDSEELPDNYRSIVINPMNSRAKVY